jgi:hypothetical protein
MQAIYSKKTFLSAALLLVMMLFTTAANAGWVLYDDFSSGKVDTTKWDINDESFGAVSCYVSNNKLIFAKSAASNDEVDYGLYVANLPAGANGLKADVRLVSATGEISVQMEFRVDGGDEYFNTDTEHATTTRFRNTFETYDRWDSTGFYNEALCRRQAVDDSSLRHVYGMSQLYLNESDELYKVHTSSVQVSNDYAYLTNCGGRCRLFQERNDGVETTNNKVVRIKFNGTPEGTGTMEVDNVYIHVGDMETDAPVSRRVVVVPLGS